MKLIFDIETNALRIQEIENFWCGGAKPLDEDKVFMFTSLSEYLDYLLSAEELIGHNIIGYDIPALKHLSRSKLGKEFNPQGRITDTLILSRLYNYGMPNGHSLDAWGRRLGCEKIEFNDYSRFSEEMLEYCEQDVIVNAKVYEWLQSRITDRPEFRDAIDIEHYMSHVAVQMHEDGFKFNVDHAKRIHTNVTNELSQLDSELVKAFPPKEVFVKEIVPKAKKDGSLSRVGLTEDEWATATVGRPIRRCKTVPFDPNSNAQIVQRLNDSGWRPIEKTKGHIKAERDKDKEKLEKFKLTGWKVSEVNLATLPEDAPEAAKKLVRRLFLEGRRRTLQEWFDNYNETTGRIHGTITPLGCWTQRCSHSKPNMGNVPSTATKYKSKELIDLAKLYGSHMRSMWMADEGSYLVGTDASGIQLRILAHIINDPTFIEAIVNGEKSKKTDIHNLNMKALGDVCRDRSVAKTFIYAWLLGSGVARTAMILGCSNKEATEARDNFVKAYPGLENLKKVIIPKDARRGYFEGVDGRLVICDSEHLMLAGYLQNGESVVMKHATRQWMRDLDELGIKYKLVNFVHDEWQTCVYGTLDEANLVGKIQADALRKVGEQLGLNCPLEGEYDVGFNWYDTH